MKSRAFLARALPALLCLALFLTLLCGTAGAAEEEKVYTIDSSEFVIRLNTDGSADVSETWTVSYLSGSFTRV